MYKKILTLLVITTITTSTFGAANPRSQEMVPKVYDASVHDNKKNIKTKLTRYVVPFLPETFYTVNNTPGQVAILNDHFSKNVTVKPVQHPWAKKFIIGCNITTVVAALIGTESKLAKQIAYTSGTLGAFAQLGLWGKRKIDTYQHQKTLQQSVEETVKKLTRKK